MHDVVAILANKYSFCGSYEIKRKCKGIGVATWVYMFVDASIGARWVGCWIAYTNVELRVRDGILINMQFLTYFLKNSDWDNTT